MKKILAVALAALIGAAAFGTTKTAYAVGNDITMEKFEAAFRDNYTGYYYKNLTNMDKFVAALQDDYTPERYGAAEYNARYAAILAEKNADLAASAKDVPERCAANGAIDYLSDASLVARAFEGCNNL
ncbi:MAG TPA: hypothetical protein VNK06_02780 [Thermodesulfobacteriota bacterium]|nr:hypothetical protein [Thermodesulfobacteriota bacterium]